jgi:anaerobic C4-dicarboxylate transporter
MFAEKTVRMRPIVVEAETVRLRGANEPRADVPMKPLPKPISAQDGKTVRLRPVDLPVVGTVARTLRQRYADLSKVKRPPSKWELARMALILVLAAMPILAISVEVFGLASQSTITMVTLTLAALLATLIVFAPHRTDMIVGRGLIAGMVACIVYDAARLFAVHVLGLMGDFIPVMGSFVTGEPDTAGSAAVGYVYRYVGDAGGLGVAFFVVAFALGIDRWSNVKAVLAAIGFAVFPTWAGLMATVALAPHGEERMFTLNVATFTITLIGHVIFGLFLGLAFTKAPRGRDHSEWPWTPILETRFVKKIRSQP